MFVNMGSMPKFIVQFPFGLLYHCLMKLFTLIRNIFNLHTQTGAVKINHMCKLMGARALTGLIHDVLTSQSVWETKFPCLF